MSIEASSTGNTRTTIRKLQIGTVVTDRRNKTISVELKRLVKHPRYGKYIYRSTVCHAHDEQNEARVGDRVNIQETRPLSKQKRWRLVSIVDKTKLVSDTGGKK